MDRETAVRVWCSVAKGAPDDVVTGRTLEAFANAIEVAQREKYLILLRQILLELQVVSYEISEGGYGSALNALEKSVQAVREALK